MMLDDALEAMKRSPIFSMSLGSKELFHSNFLWWLCRSYPDEMGLLFSRFISDQTGSTRIVKVDREKGNIDLSLVLGNSQRLIVENKVKSMPDHGQLERYAEENSGADFLLLALVKPPFMSLPGALKSPWQFLGYGDLGRELTHVGDALTDAYHKMLIRDYSDVVSALAVIAEATTVRLEDNFDYFDDSRDSMLKSLKECRFQDWYLKRKSELMALKVEERLRSLKVEDRLKEMTPGAGIIRESDVWKSPAGNIGVSSGMTRGEGLADVWYSATPGMVFGVQVQGNRYKLMLSSKKDGACSRAAEEVRDWFEPTDLKMEPAPKGGSWNKYGQTTVYRYSYLSSDLKISTVVELMVKGILNALEAARGLSRHV